MGREARLEMNETSGCASQKKNPSPPPPGFSHFLLPAAKSQEEELPWAPQGVSMDAQKTQEAGVGVKSRSISFSPCKIGFIFNYVYLCGYAHVSVGAHRCWKRVSDPWS